MYLFVFACLFVGVFGRCVRLFACLFAWLFGCLFVCLFVCLSVCFVNLPLSIAWTRGENLRWMPPGCLLGASWVLPGCFLVPPSSWMGPGWRQLGSNWDSDFLDFLCSQKGWQTNCKRLSKMVFNLHLKC